jgi:hypothetical protein
MLWVDYLGPEIPFVLKHRRPHFAVHQVQPAPGIRAPVQLPAMSTPFLDYYNALQPRVSPLPADGTFPVLLRSNGDVLVKCLYG